MEKLKYQVALKTVKQEGASEPYLKSNKNSIEIFNLSTYNYDLVVPPDSDLSPISFLSPFLAQCFKGVNVNIFSHISKGLPHQTYLLSTPTLKTEVLQQLFSYEFRQSYTYSCSMFQINEDIMSDLLQSPAKVQKLQIKKDLNQLVMVENLAEFVVEKQTDCEFLISQGFESEFFKASEQSACFFQFNIESRKANSKGLFMKAKISLIDLPSEGSCLKAFYSCVTCLSNSSTVPYKDSKLTQVLSDSLNLSSVNAIIAQIPEDQIHANSTLETLEFLQNFQQIQVQPIKNMFNSTSPAIKPEMFRLKTNLKYKKPHEEIWNLKEETEHLKLKLNKKTSIQEVEELIKENKGLRIELQQLIGRPLAENDLEHPDSFQDALVLTEDLIKRRKLDLASAEMKEKLSQEGRCLICTLKLPCKHSDSEALVLHSNHSVKPFETQKPDTPTFLTGADFEGPRRFRIRSSRAKAEIMDAKFEDKDEKMIKEAQKRLNVLSKIEAYREEKLRKEIEKMEDESKAEKELQEKKKAEEEKKKKYFDAQREKLNEYLVKKRYSEEAKKVKQRPKSHIIRKRPATSNIKIRDYENRRYQVMEILKQQSKIIRTISNFKDTNELPKVEDSVDLLYIN